MTSQMRSVVKVMTVVMVLAALGASCLFLMKGENEGVACGPWGAEYQPVQSPTTHMSKNERYDPAIHVANFELDFVLRIEKGDCENCSARSAFLYFDAYDRNGTKVSSMRLSNASSNGVSIESFSTEMGEFCNMMANDVEGDCLGVKPSIGFQVIGVGSDLSPKSIRTAADLLIFQNTYHELKRVAGTDQKEWEKYIRFYTDEKVFPDFSFRDFWVRKKCGSPVEEKE